MAHSHAQNAWSNTSHLGGEEAFRLAAFLDARGRMPDQAQVNADFVAALAPNPNARWLEVGCGTGALCQLVAKHLGADGHVTGVDVSPEMLAVAQQQTTEANLQTRVTYTLGDATALPFTDGHFNAAFAARLLLHVADPVEVAREMARVVRPLGRVDVLEWDWETIAVDHSDRALTRRILHWRCDQHGGNNWSGRQLVGWLHDAGLTDVRGKGLVSVVEDEATSLTQSLWRAADVALAGEAISVDEHAAWLTELRERLTARRFFASISYFIASGQRAPKGGD